MTDEMDNIVVLTDENGEDQEFEHLDTILFKDSYYVALTPLSDETVENDDDSAEQEVYIMKVVKENDEDALVTVDDEEELDEVFEEFQMRFDENDGDE